MSKRLIHIVTITPSPDTAPIQFYVRHDSPAKARNWLLDNQVEVRVADQNDIIDMVQEDITPIGPYEEPEADDAPVQAGMLGG